MEIGILLIDVVDLCNGRIVLYKALQGITTACKGEESNIGVSLVKDVGNHLSAKKESVHFIGGADILYETIFETGDLMDYFCYIKVFWQI